MSNVKSLAIGYILITALVTLLTGCNKQIVDLDYTYNYAIIQLPNGDVVEGKVDSWKDYEDGEQLQIKINGTIYLCSSYNCVLLNKDE